MRPIGKNPGDASRKGFLKFAIAFLAIILIGYVVFIVSYNIQNWDAIQKNKQLEKDIERALEHK